MIGNPPEVCLQLQLAMSQTQLIHRLLTASSSRTVVCTNRVENRISLDIVMVLGSAWFVDFLNWIHGSSICVHY